jgi:hypothetical protein
MDVLYSIAAGGGAYCDGFGLVDGRLRAWQSLAGLVGAPKQASVAEVETLALNSLWFEFRARSEWYSSDLWDVGILAVRPDKQSISVLAGTNMD